MYIIQKKPIILVPIVALLVILLFVPIDVGKRHVSELDFGHLTQLNLNFNSKVDHYIVEKVEYEVKKGDTLETIFTKLNFSTQLAYDFSVSYPALNKIVPQQKFIFSKNQLNQLEKIEYFTSPNKIISLIINANGKIEINKNSIKLITRIKYVKGVIKDSLYLDGIKYGLDDALVVLLTEIFAWDIDFNRQIQPNDAFSVIFKQAWNNNEWVNTQEILAAEFKLGNKLHTAIKYTYDGKEGYFDTTGKNLRKAFTRNPVKNVRITSKFNPKRRHPVLHKIRAHKGVDYGAPVGTPIYATGDGIVEFKGWKGGFGKVIILRHGKIYSTLYAHLSKFNSRTVKGKQVRQGQVIGYVGATGRTTGPHLHYEFRINNRHKDPLKVNLPAAISVKRQDVASFNQGTAPFAIKLKLMRTSTPAQIAVSID